MGDVIYRQLTKQYWLRSRCSRCDRRARSSAGGLDARQDLDVGCDRSFRGHRVANLRKTALRGGLNWSAQHSNLLAKMECGHEAATSHLLLGGPAIRYLESLAGRRADEFDRTPI